MNTPRKKSAMRPRTILILLALIFLLPMAVAWVLFYTSDHWQTGETSNHGILVTPPRPLNVSYPLSGKDGEPLAGKYLRGKWTLLYFGDSKCGITCSNYLYKMRQARLAQNENMNRVQRLFVSIDGAAPAQSVLEDYPNMDVAILPRQGQEEFLFPFVIENVLPHKAERIYLIDPLGNLMMYYPTTAEPKGMLKDLQRLLKISTIG